MTVTAQAYVLETPKTPLVRRPLQVPAPGPAEAIVEVIACGLCHTDLGYADGSVPTKKGIPLVLGHEAVGRVVEAGKDFASLIGSNVLVPAVLPCGECPFCRAGRGNACPNQKMPGNDIDGGFSTHFLVPARPLIKIGASSNIAALSVVADAVSTAYQAILRANVAAGDVGRLWWEPAAWEALSFRSPVRWVPASSHAISSRNASSLIAGYGAARDHQSGEPGPQGTPQAGAGLRQRSPHAEL